MLVNPQFSSRNYPKRFCATSLCTFLTETFKLYVLCYLWYRTSQDLLVQNQEVLMLKLGDHFGFLLRLSGKQLGGSVRILTLHESEADDYHLFKNLHYFHALRRLFINNCPMLFRLNQPVSDGGCCTRNRKR